MKSKTYWKQRAEDNVKHADKLTDKALKREQKLYRDTYKKVQAKIDDIYNHFLAEGEISTTKLYQYGKWQNLQRELQRDIQGLGQEQLNFMQTHLEQIYQETLGRTSSELGQSIRFGASQKRQMQNVLQKNWSGKSFSTRIWDNTSKLASQVQKTIIDNVSMGRGKDYLIKDLTTRFNVGYSDAERLARTETMYVTNQSQAEGYKEAGITKYEFLAEIDDVTSEECDDLNGQIFNFDEMIVGENYPPIHPNCRSTVIPVTDLY